MIRIAEKPAKAKKIKKEVKKAAVANGELDHRLADSFPMIKLN